MDLAGKRHWIFDMDGTLTVAAHDFDAIRDALGLPQGRPILEQLADLPEAASRDKYARLDEIELDIARRARPQQGARELLMTLAGRGVRLGIVTRNSHKNALETLRSCSLLEFFEPDNVVGRDRCDPKPSADGIHRLLGQWGASPDDTVMVGDYAFDIESGQKAGTATVCFDEDGTRDFARLADMTVRSLNELCDLIGRPIDRGV